MHHSGEALKLGLHQQLAKGLDISKKRQHSCLQPVQTFRDRSTVRQTIPINATSPQLHIFSQISPRNRGLDSSIIRRNHHYRVLLNLTMRFTLLIFLQAGMASHLPVLNTHKGVGPVVTSSANEMIVESDEISTASRTLVTVAPSLTSAYSADTTSTCTPSSLCADYINSCYMRYGG